MKQLLPPVKSKDAGKICVVIDLDETLVHSSFKVVLSPYCDCPLLLAVSNTRRPCFAQTVHVVSSNSL